MLNFSRNEWRTRARTKSSGLGRGEKFRVERFTDFLSHSERERMGRIWRWGNAVRTSYFLFARQKRRGATSQTRRNPVAPLTYCRSLWYCWKLLHAPRSIRLIAAGNVDDDDESSNWERERTKKTVYSRFCRITSDNVLVQRRFIRYSNASSSFDLLRCERINYNNMNVWFLLILHLGIFEIFRERKLIQCHGGFEI